METRFEKNLLAGAWIVLGVYFSTAWPRALEERIASGKLAPTARKWKLFARICGVVLLFTGIFLFVIATFFE